jgi:uncharacterized protein
MNSAIYHGWLRHRRYAPREHRFRYPLFMLYLDLAELDEVFRGRWLWSTRRPAPARFDRAGHLGDPAVPLERAVRDLVAQSTGRQLCGPICLLTHLRYWGYGFNPVSFYYCFDASGENVVCMVAEVNNTPWGEQHCYVLDTPSRSSAGSYLHYRSAKKMHVSPFMPMELTYDWGFGAPGARLGVHMALHPASAATPRAPQSLFDATLILQRVPITTAALAWVLLRFPLMTARVTTAIHWQALRLWLKGVPVHPHPNSASNLSAQQHRRQP